jgi:hypothetical protein
VRFGASAMGWGTVAGPGENEGTSGAVENFAGF